ETLAAQTAGQMNTVNEARSAIDALAREIAAVRQSQDEISHMHETLVVEREALERCADRMSAMAVQAPALEAKMDVILGKLPLVTDGTLKASQLSGTVNELTAHL